MSPDPVDYWDRRASGYDDAMAGLERRLLVDSRRWIGDRAGGRTLELAVGTGANFAHYRPGVELTGIDVSSGMLTEAARRPWFDAPESPALARADVVALPFADGTFACVVCTFALCGVPDVEATLVEALRVLRPGGRLLLADHIAGHWPLRLLQHLVDLITVPLQGEHFTRRPLKVLQRLAADPSHQVTIEQTERLMFGVIERVQAATTPGPS